MQTAERLAATLNEGFVVAITITARPGEEEAVAAILRDLIDPTLAEPGVKVFAPYRSPSDPAAFFIYELYADEAGWSAHNASPHFRRAIADLLPRVAHRQRVPFIPYA